MAGRAGCRAPRAAPCAPARRPAAPPGTCPRSASARMSRRSRSRASGCARAAGARRARRRASSVPPMPRQAATYASSARSSVSSSRRRQASSHGRSSSSGQQRARRDVLRAQRGAPGTRPVALDDRGLGAVHGGERLLDVDPRVGRQREAHLAAPGQHVGSDGGAQLGQQHGQRRGVVLRRSVAPRAPRSARRGRPARALEHEVGEERAALPARDALLHTAPAQLDHEAPAELDVGLRRALQPRSNLCATYGKGPAPTIGPTSTMARQITCECGQIVRGETEQ